MKTMIVVFGWENRGKSSAIRAIANRMGLILPVDNFDFTGTIKYEDHLIGFASQGDPNSNQIEWIQNLIDQECDVIVCASRTKGQTTYNVISLANQYGYRLIWTSHYCVDKESLKILGLNEEQIERQNETMNGSFARAIETLIVELSSC